MDIHTDTNEILMELDGQRIARGWIQSTWSKYVPTTYRAVTAFKDWVGRLWV